MDFRENPEQNLKNFLRGALNNSIPLLKLVYFFEGTLFLFKNLIFYIRRCILSLQS
jgi:hypothetical protein